MITPSHLASSRATRSLDDRVLAQESEHLLGLQQFQRLLAHALADAARPAHTTFTMFRVHV